MNAAVSERSIRLRFARTDTGLYLHLMDRATHQVWPAAQRIVGAYRRARPHETLVTIDCENCRWIDSTLAGWLLETAIELRAANGGLRLANCSRGFRDGLARLHIADLFEYCRVAAPAESRTARFAPCHAISDRLLLQMLRSHQVLMKIHRDNALLLAPVVAAIHLELAKRGQADSADQLWAFDEGCAQAEPTAVFPEKRGETAT